MDVLESVRQLGDSLSEQPRRVAVSAMGVFWGAAAIVLMLSWGGAFGDFLRTEFGRYGKPAVWLLPGVSSSGFPGYRPGVPVRISRDDVLAVERENRDSVTAIVAEHWSQERVLVEARGRVRRLDLTATDDRFPWVRNFEIGKGRFFSTTELARARAVAVIGHEAAEDLFGDVHMALGRTLRVNGQPFELIGVFAYKRGRQYNNTDRPENRILVVPITAAQSRLGFDRDAVGSATAFVRPGANSQATLRAVRSALAVRAGFHPDDEDALWTFDMAAILAQLDLMKLGLTLFIGVAGTITLLVGGIGIANYHLATLSERAVEIAVAKAIGATDAQLVRQTILESVVVSAGAGLLGVGFGVSVAMIAARFIPASVFPPPVLSPSVGVVAVVALIAVTTLSALIPALRVRKLDVSLALREAA